MQRDAEEIALIGAGVVGLSCAIRLREAGFGVTVLAERRTPNTTSDRAGAVFSPFRAGGDERLRRWVRRSYEVFAGLAGGDAGVVRPAGRDAGPTEAAGGDAGPTLENGVSLTRLREYFFTPQTGAPWWAELVDGFRKLAPAPAGYSAVVEARMPRMDMARYMPWLEQRLAALSGSGAALSAGGTTTRIVDERIDSFSTVFARGFRTVVNCSGLGARVLANDSAMTPLRGQILHVPNDIGLDDCLVEEGRGEQVTYIFSFPGQIVLGGTYERGQWEERTDEAALAEIVARCRNLLHVAGYEGAERLAVRPLRALAGLRPARVVGEQLEAVRLECEECGGGRRIIHNYGHGRTGVTLSWGCAEDVVELVRRRGGSR